MKYIIKVDEFYVQVNDETFNISYVDKDNATEFDNIKTLVEKAEQLSIHGYEPERV